MHAESAANEKTKKDRNQEWQLGTPNKHQLPPLPRKEKSKCDAKAEKAVKTITEQAINTSTAGG